mgnify:CR=1 FL=1
MEKLQFRCVEATYSRWNGGTLWSNPLFPVVQLKIVHIEDGLQVVILNSHFPVTASGSFRSCRCFMKFLRHGPATSCNKFSAYSTPHVEGLNLVSLSQRKSSLWLHRAFPPYHRRFSESMARKPTRYVSSLT